MKNSLVRIYIYYEYDDLSIKLINYNIYYSDLIKDKKYYIITVNYNDYLRLKRRYKCELIRYYGIPFYINFIKDNKYMIISFFISLLFLYMLCNTIFDIKINTENNDFKKIIINSLSDYDIEKYKRKKNFNDIQNIKNKILFDNKDRIEWIEIREIGCNYIIDVTPRIKKEGYDINDIPSDIVASKDGKILYIVSTKGQTVKEKNDYVKKGEVLISGNIMKNDKLSYQVNSEGLVYAETWYRVKTTIPFEYVEYIDTGKMVNRYYLDVFGTEMTLIGLYKKNNTLNTKKLLLDKPYLPFRLYKEEMKIYDYKKFHINESEAFNEAIKRSDRKIKDILDVDEYIISKKVLKKEVFSSKIIVEVFYKVYENIGVNKTILKKDE